MKIFPHLFTPRWIAKSFSLAVACLVCTAPLVAQSRFGTITGRVTDKDRDTAMPSAEVAIQDSDRNTVSDQGGYFSFTGIQPAEITIVASYAGYISESRKVVVTAGQNVVVDFELRLTPEIKQSDLKAATGRKEEVVEMAKLVVSTERAGNARVFMEQKNSMSMSIIASTDSYGEVAEGNVAEFLKFMPGVQLNYNGDDDSTTISLGGMDAQYVGISMDGATMASAAGGNFDEGTRAFQFDQASINSIESIELITSPGADQPGDKPAGMINMRTRSAFDRKVPTIAYNITLAGSPSNFILGRAPGPGDSYSRKMSPGFKLDYTLPLIRNVMGVAVGLSRSVTYKDRNGITMGYSGLDTDQPYVRTIQYKDSPQMSTRYNGNIRFDYKPSLFSKMAVSANIAGSGVDSVTRTVTVSPASPTNRNSSLTNIFTTDRDGTSNISVGGSRNYRSGRTYDLRGNYLWKRSRFEVESSASYSWSNSKTEAGTRGFFSTVPLSFANNSSTSDPNVTTGWLHLTRPDARSTKWALAQVPVTGYSRPTNSDLSELSNYTLGDLSAPYEKSGREGILYIKGDIAWNAPTRRQLQFKAGFTGTQDRRTSMNALNFSKTYRYLGDPQYRPADAVIDKYKARPAFRDYEIDDLGIPADYPYLTFHSPYHFNPHVGGNIASFNIPSVNREMLYRTFLEHPDWFYETVESKSTQLKYDLSGEQNLQETALSGYFQTTSQITSRLKVQAGIRYETTDQEGKTMVPYTRGQMTMMGWTPDYKDDERYIRLQYKDGARTKIVNSYSNVLPSASLKYAFGPNLNGEAAYRRSYSRPSVDKIAANWRVNDEMGIAQAPNPKLSPDVYDKATVRFQYMFEPAGKFSIQYGYQTWPGKLYDPVECLVEDDFAKLKQSYDPELIDGFIASGYRVFTYESNNSIGRKMQTIDFDYSQNIPFIRGLQVSASFSRVIPNWIKTNTAPKKATASATYSYRKWRGSVIAIWDDRTWTGVSSDETRPYNSKKRYARFDMNVDLYYRFTNAFQFYASFTNILNDPTTIYVGTRADIMLSSDLPGTTIRFGIRGNF